MHVFISFFSYPCRKPPKAHAIKSMSNLFPVFGWQNTEVKRIASYAFEPKRFCPASKAVMSMMVFKAIVSWIPRNMPIFPGSEPLDLSLPIKPHCQSRSPPAMISCSYSRPPFFCSPPRSRPPDRLPVCFK